MEEPGYKKAQRVSKTLQGNPSRVLNNLRFSLLISSLIFLAIGVKGLFAPEVTFTTSDNVVIVGWEAIKIYLGFAVGGLIGVIFRFTIFKRKFHKNGS